MQLNAAQNRQMQHSGDESPSGQNQAEPPPVAPWSITQDPERKEITNLKLKVLLVVSSEKIKFKPRNIWQLKVPLQTYQYQPCITASMQDVEI